MEKCEKKKIFCLLFFPSVYLLPNQNTKIKDAGWNMTISFLETIKMGKEEEKITEKSERN